MIPEPPLPPGIDPSPHPVASFLAFMLDYLLLVQTARMLFVARSRHD